MNKIYTALVLPLLLITACANTPVNAVPVAGFDAQRYLGTWYEVARLDHSFERGLSNVTANYSERDDGKITVLNRGYNEKKGAFEKAQGKAKFTGAENVGHLEVSFFGPFYGDYIIFDLDQTNYSYAFISGGNDKYLWLLSRTPTISQAVRQDFLTKSKALGYNVDDLLWVDHNRAP